MLVLGNGVGIITCEGGFPPGASTSGARMRIGAQGGKVLIEGQAVEIAGKDVIE